MTLMGRMARLLMHKSDLLGSPNASIMNVISLSRVCMLGAPNMPGASQAYLRMEGRK